MWSPAATGSGVPLIVRALRRWSRDGSDAAGRRQRGARAVRQYAHLPGSVSQFLHQLTYHEEGIFSIFTICEEGVFSRFPLIYSHFHSRLLTTSEKSKISSENFLQPPQSQQSKSCRRWTPPSAVRLPPYHEKASVSCAFCLNMTFLVNKGR